MSRLSRRPSLRPVGCQHTATSLTKTPLFDVKTVKTSVLTTCRLPTYSYKFDKKHPCLMSRLSRLPSLRPVGCQHSAASLTKTPLFDVKTVKTSVLTTCRLPTYSCKFDQKHPCLMSRLSRLPSLGPVGCQHTAASLTKNTPVWCQDCQDFRPTSVLTTCRLPTYSYKFDKKHPCLMSRLSRLPSLRPADCQHTAASLTQNTPVWCQDFQDFRPYDL